MLILRTEVSISVFTANSGLISCLNAQLKSEFVKPKLLSLLITYIKNKILVELKGKVACEMGMNELLITELVLRNILADLQAAEVAALLSALVFQAKTRCEPNLTDELKKVKFYILFC